MMMPVSTCDDRLLPLREARHLTGLSSTTLRRWTKDGRLVDRRSVGGHRRFLVSELEAATGARFRRALDGKQPTVVIYGRVSSRRQAGEGDLDRQMGRLKDWVLEHRPSMAVESFSDVASGLSDRRPGLRRALERCQAEEVVELVVAHPERLARFGTGLITSLLAGHGVTVSVVGNDEDLSDSSESELVRDMLAVVTSFSGKLYGQRSAKARALRRCVSKAVAA